MKLLISGAKGLVGSALTAAWRSQGHRVLTLVRKPADLGVDAILWSPPDGGPDPSAIEGLDAMIHLSGEPIAGGRWTAERKAAIFSSRTENYATSLSAKSPRQVKKR